VTDVTWYLPPYESRTMNKVQKSSNPNCNTTFNIELPCSARSICWSCVYLAKVYKNSFQPWNRNIIFSLELAHFISWSVRIRFDCLCYIGSRSRFRPNDKLQYAGTEVALTYLRRQIIVLEDDHEESQNCWICGPHYGDYEEFYLLGYTDFQRTTQSYIPEDRTPHRKLVSKSRFETNELM
jgi:hypothetical protein